MSARYASDIREDSFPSPMPRDFGAPVDRRRRYPKDIPRMQHLAKPHDDDKNKIARTLPFSSAPLSVIGDGSDKLYKSGRAVNATL